MNRKTMAIALLAVLVVGAGGYGVYRLGMNKGMEATAGAAPAAHAGAGGALDPATGRKVLYWHDPMVPGQKFDKPGKSPFMDMQLVPVYADAPADEGKVSISPVVEQNLGMRTADVTRGKLTMSVEAVGTVAYNERDVALVQARSAGFVERLFVRAPLDPVKKGQPLAAVYVPDWVAAQEEFLAVKRMPGNGLDGLLDGARQRMRLAGMTDAQIRAVDAGGKVQPRVTINAPVGGVVSELSVREGTTVAVGAPMFRINGLGTVWVNAEVPEAAAAQVRPGTLVEARTPSSPGTVLNGRVSAILPEVDPATRTLRARVELENPGQRLVPGMFATVRFTPAAGTDTLLVPTEAVIRTGQRSVVMVALGEGKFAPVEVEPGTEGDGKTEIRRGLAAGQKVVVSGQFLIDSEASLRGTATRLAEPPKADQVSQAPQGVQPRPADTVAGTGADTGAGRHRGEGKVESIDKDEIVLSHGPIPSLQWPPMTMGFKLRAGGLPGEFAVGDPVTFEFRQSGEGEYEIINITRTPGEKKGWK
ncbi:MULTISPECIES: efflux RND transporter periplasmic adaptor subunit [Massilia]|uniref:Efflux RND transporter periplasmic adaptor subunit n=2 Tax=Massilia TaxID=149698 RepID=A0A5C7FUA8_9BURK|nr:MULTISPECIES: efflux RND transporter periplasmic adaptor subunit [Massilia]TXF98361.1 efflux RND transporter periplasmic adaptor subunit [Massilia arenae]